MTSVVSDFARDIIFDKKIFQLLITSSELHIMVERKTSKDEENNHSQEDSQ